MAPAELEAALGGAVWAFAGFSEALRRADTGDAQFVRQVAEALCARQTGVSGPRLPSAELEAALDGAVRAFAEFHEALRRADPRDAQFVRQAADALLRLPAAALPPSSALPQHARHVHGGPLAAEDAQWLARRIERAMAATESET